MSPTQYLYSRGRKFKDTLRILGDQEILVESLSKALAAVIFVCCCFLSVNWMCARGVSHNLPAAFSFKLDRTMHLQKGALWVVVDCT